MIPLDEDQACIDDLLVGNGTPYQILDLSVMNFPDTRINDYNVPGQDGVGMAPYDPYSGKQAQGRILVLAEAPLATPTGAGRAEARANLNILLAKLRGTHTSPDKELGVRPGGETDSTRMVGRFRIVTVDDSKIQHGHALVVWSFGSKLSYREAGSEDTITIGLPVPSAGRTYPRTYPLVYGATGSPGIGIVVNEGEVPVFPRFRINGNANGVTDPTIRHVNSGRQLTFTNLTIPASSYLEIDSRAATAMLDGTASRLEKLTVNQWFALDPGNNDIQFTANTVLTGATLDVFWRSGYL